MLVLEEEQGSPAPGAIERTLVDYAWSVSEPGPSRCRFGCWAKVTQR